MEKENEIIIDYIEKNDYKEICLKSLNDHYAEWKQQYEHISSNLKKRYQYNDFRYMTDVVECYCGEDYKGINDYLRTGKDFDSNTFREKAHILWLTLLYAPGLPQNSIVYRSICQEFANEIIEKSAMGSNAQEEGFMSTSASKKAAFKFKNDNYILKIFVDKGTPAIYVDSICERGEEEILMPPKGFLKLLCDPYVDEETSVYILECHLIYG